MKLGTSIALRSATKRFGAVLAIDNVSLDIKAGEFLTLLGPSGSGKTSLLMAIAGFVTLDAGDIEVDSQSILALPPYRRNLGVVFQQYALFPHLNVRDNVSYPLAVRGVPKPEIRRAVGDALALVKLSGLESRYPGELSGGQQQRVALARALVFKPPVLLMDEPLSALDRKLRTEMQIEIRSIQKQLRITTVYVTHDQEEALTMSDRIVVMREGRIAGCSTPSELYERPTSEFVAGFLGDTNFLRGRVVEIRKDDCKIVTAAGLAFTLPGSSALTVGQNVLASVRPERVRIGPETRIGDATVRHAIYLGYSTRLVLELCGETIVALVAGRPMSDLPQAGDIIPAGWDNSAPVLLQSGAGE